MARTKAAIAVDENTTNGAKDIIAFEEPFTVRATIEGVADMLLHRWNCDAVEEKANAKKGSAAKKSDDLESYVYRDDNGTIGIPGEYVRQSIIHAAKFRQDPRSPRKSAMDLFKAGVQSLTLLAPLGVKRWDYEDRRRVVVMKSGITRTRPAMLKGWRVTVDLFIATPEYIDFGSLRETLLLAGRLVGIGDFRPTYGRFVVQSFERL